MEYPGIDVDYAEYLDHMLIPHLKHCTWSLQRCWWPKKCIFSREQLFFKKAMRGERLITGPGTPIVEHYWVKEDVFTFEKLKGTI